jgi:hypothetical protein
MLIQQSSLFLVTTLLLVLGFLHKVLLDMSTGIYPVSLFSPLVMDDSAVDVSAVPSHFPPLVMDDSAVGLTWCTIRVLAVVVVVVVVVGVVVAMAVIHISLARPK